MHRFYCYPLSRQRAFVFIQLRFNYFIQRGRAIIERTKGLLKQRMQSIRETMTAVTEEKAKRMILACIALHNESILSGDLVA